MIEIILSSITFLLNSFLGLVVFIRNSKAWTNRIFLVLVFLINAYLVVNYISLHPPGPAPEIQLFWIRVVMFVCSFIGPILFLLVHTFPNAKFTLKKKILIPLIILCLISASASLGPFVFSSLEFPGGKPVPVPGPAIPIFFFDFVGLFVISFIFLIIKYIKSKGLIKVQLFYFLAGIILTFSVMGISTVVFVVILKRSDFVFLGPISTLFLILCIAYSIIRHRFLDIRSVVARSVAYTLVIALTGSVYTISIFLISSLLSKEAVNVVQALVYGSLALFAALTFQPLKNFLEKFTDKIFFRSKYNSNELVLTLTKIMATTLRLEELTKNTLHELLKTMRITRGVFIIFPDKEGEYKQIHEGFEKDIEFEKDVVNKIASFKRILIFDEEDEGIKQMLRPLNIAVVLPLFKDNYFQGVLILCEKKSGDIYSQQDIEVLQIFSPEISVAIQNAKSYEEISKFNITLQQKIDKATEELRVTNQKLVKLDQLKDEFVSVASHELRTPMTAIKSYLWMTLDNRGGPISEKQKFYLDRAYKSVDRLIRLVNDMLNVSRIDSGRISIELNAVALDNIVGEVFDEVNPRAQELGLTFKMIPPKTTIPKVLADSDKIKEVLFNLIGNALKFTPKGGTITVSFVQKGDFIETTVSDTGTGILPEDISKLFQKFSMIDGSFASDKSIQGTGLGLYISRSVVELHRGKIWVTSAGRDKGSQFTFSLPIFHEGDSRYNPQTASGEKKTVGIIHTEV